MGYNKNDLGIFVEFHAHSINLHILQISDCKQYTTDDAQISNMALTLCYRVIISFVGFFFFLMWDNREGGAWIYFVDVIVH